MDVDVRCGRQTGWQVDSLLYIIRWEVEREDIYEYHASLVEQKGQIHVALEATRVVALAHLLYLWVVKTVEMQSASLVSQVEHSLRSEAVTALARKEEQVCFWVVAEEKMDACWTL